MTFRERVCPECAYPWNRTGEDLVLEFGDAPARYTELLRRCDPNMLRARREPGSWSALEYLGHVSDAVEWYRERISVVLDRPGAHLESFDWDAATARRRFNDYAPHHLLFRLTNSCDAARKQLESLTGDGWAASGIGSSDGGIRSVLDLARRSAHELRHHHLDIRRTAKSA